MLRDPNLRNERPKQKQRKRYLFPYVCTERKGKKKNWKLIEELSDLNIYIFFFLCIGKGVVYIQKLFRKRGNRKVSESEEERKRRENGRRK